MKMLHVDEQMPREDADWSPQRTWSVVVNPMHIVKAEPAGSGVVHIFLPGGEKLTIVCAWSTFCDMIDEAMS